MTHFLARLVERARGTAPRIEPIIAPRFGPAPVAEIGTEIEAAPKLNRGKVPAQPNKLPPPPAAARQDEPAQAHAEANESRIEVVWETLLVPPEVPETPPPLLVRQTKFVEHNAAPARASTIPPAQAGSRAQARPSLQSPPIRIPPRTPALPNEQPAEPPIVRITIGRIEVRAAPVPAAPSRKAAPTSGPKLTLDAYLKSRKEGAR